MNEFEYEKENYYQLRFQVEIAKKFTYNQIILNISYSLNNLFV